MGRRLRVVHRDEWGARRSKKPPTPMRLPAPRVWVHHTAGAFHRAPSWGERTFKARACAYVRGVQAYHQDSKGWNDIAYSWLVFRAAFGRLWVFEGRGWGVQGAHTEGDNDQSHAFALVGNYDADACGDGLVQAVGRMVRRGKDRGFIARGAPVAGHRDAPGAATACPGRYAYARLGDFRSAATVRASR